VRTAYFSLDLVWLYLLVGDDGTVMWDSRRLNFFFFAATSRDVLLATVHFLECHYYGGMGYCGWNFLSSRHGSKQVAGQGAGEEGSSRRVW